MSPEKNLNETGNGAFNRFDNETAPPPYGNCVDDLQKMQAENDGEFRQQMP